MKRSELKQLIREEIQKVLKEENSIYSDALDAPIEVGDNLKLKDGTKVVVGAIPLKANPKYSQGIIVVADSSNKGRGNMTIDINKDILRKI